MAYKPAPTMCEECTNPTKSKVETCGPETKMKPVVTYICDNEDCDVKRSEKLIEEIKKRAAEPKPKKSPSKKATGKKEVAKKK